MKKKRISRLLGWLAVGVFTTGLMVWVGGGARLGWTQTSVVAMQHDEITGIDYPVRQSAFRPGVEVPLLATATAATFAGLGYFTRRRLAGPATIR
jgi:hypothetical protein